MTSITEEPSFVKNFFQKHVVKRVASKPYLRSSTSPEPKQKGTGRGAASLPPPSKGKGKDVMKAHISAPDMKVRRSSSGASKLSNEIKLDSPTTPTLKYDPARYSTVPNTTIKRTSEARNEKFVLAEARMAPMEYARKFLIEKANAHKENRDCSLPPFLYSYYWAPKYERWFLTPKLPESIKRAYGTRIYRSNDVERSTAETNAVDLEQIMGNPDCPRLSLHLGQIESLLPSMTAMDLNDVDKHVYDKKSHKDAHEDTKYMMSGALGGADTSARLHEGTYPVSSATDDQKQSRHKHVKSASEGTNVTIFTQCFDEAVRAYGGSEHGESAVIYEQYANTPEASVHKETAEASVDEGIAEASEKNDDKDSFKDSQYSDDTITAFRKITEHQNRAWLTPRKEADAEGTPPSTTAKDGSSPVDGTGLDGSSPVSNWPLQPGRSRRADHGRNLFETAGGLRSYNNMHHPVLMPSASEASQRSMRAELEPRPLRVPSNTPKPASRLSPQPGSLLYEMEEKACRESFELYHRPRQLRDEPGPADNSNTLPGCNNPFATQSTTERLRLAATEAAQDKVAPEAYEESDDNGSDCDLVETMTKHNVRSDTMLLQETGRPKHIPIVLDQSRSLRSDMTTQERLAQPPRSTWSHSPSSNEERGSASRFGSLFRRKNREKSAKTPTTPSYWSPFDRHSPSPPHTKVWGEQGSPSSDKKQERANWFRSKAEQAAKSHRNRTFSGAQRSQEEVEPPTKRESPVDIQGTLDQAPVPPPSHSAFDDPRSPPAPKLPPIPPLPTDYTPTRPFAEYATNMDEADLVPFREKSARALAARAKKSSDGLKSKSSTGLRNTFLKGGSWRKGKDKDEGKGN